MSTGSITKREGPRGVSWLLKYDAGRDPLTGKRVQRYATVRGTRKAAEAELRRLLTQVDNGSDVVPSKATLTDWVRVWLRDYARPRVSLRTYEGYQLYLETYVLPILGAKPIQKLAGQHIRAMLVELQTTGKGRFGRQLGREADSPEGLSARSALHAYRVLSSCLKAAVKAHYLMRNPCGEVEPPSPARQSAALGSEDCGPIHALDRDEVQTLLHALQGKHIHPLAVVALGTGARRGELLALRWSDVDLEKRTVRINRALEKTKEAGLRFKPPKNHSSRRSISIDDGLCGALKQHREAHEDLARTLGILCPADGLVFPCLIRRSKGRQPIEKDIQDVDFTRPWNPDAVSKEFHREAGKTGFLDLRFHDLRHTHATQLLAAGIPVHIVAARLGHSTPAITLAVYAHVLPRADEQAAKVMGEMMRTALGAGS